MARIEDLVQQISDTSLRDSLAKEISKIKGNKRFGLIFEEHVPETVALNGLPIKVDDTVQDRRVTSRAEKYKVVRVGEGIAEVELLDGSDKREIELSNLLVVRRFGEPIYPSLESIERINRGPVDRPFHSVINGENFHALQLLNYVYANQVDCIYIDPPYNSGARDWKYNNRYVDGADSWRHSKWLSFMEKRLQLAKRLLKSDGVLIVTIDEHEVHHLGLNRPGFYVDSVC